MKNEKKPHEQLTTNDNGLSKTQEILYRKEFKEMEGKSAIPSNQQYNKKMNT